MDLQDQLHRNVCRNRTLVAIGAHDLDKIQGPFVYEHLDPNSIKFKPLNQEKEFTATELMELYAVISDICNSSLFNFVLSLVLLFLDG